MMQALVYFTQGFKLLISPGFRRYAVIPILLNVLIFSGLYGWAMYKFWVYFNNFQMTLPDWLGWMQSLLNWLGPLFFWIAMIGLGLILTVSLGHISSLITSIIAAPFNSLLVEKILASKLSTIKSQRLLTVFKEAILRETQKLVFLTPRLVLVYCLFAVLYFIPVINILGTLILYGFSGWLLSFEYLDYSAETSNLSFKEYKVWLKQNRYQSYSFGLLALLIASIPILNLIAVPTSVAGGALLWVHQTKKLHLK